MWLKMGRTLMSPYKFGKGCKSPKSGKSIRRAGVLFLREKTPRVVDWYYLRGFNTFEMTLASQQPPTNYGCVTPERSTQTLRKNYYNVNRSSHCVDAVHYMPV